MSVKPTPLEKEARQRAGHYEILGETYAKLEFFENGWNPYSRFLDVDKVDLVLRRTKRGQPQYREIQVKYGKLYEVGIAWERVFFDVTSWRFFKDGEFASPSANPSLFIAYVLAADVGYRGDIFVFPVVDFAQIIDQAIKNGDRRKVYISRLKTQPDRWYLRRLPRFTDVDENSCLEVSAYRRAFHLLDK